MHTHLKEIHRSMALQFAFHIILILCSMHILVSAQQNTVIAQSGCDDRCGDVMIPYPFGMNNPKCYAGKWFEIECSTTRTFNSTAPYLKQLDLGVMSIDLSEGTITILNPAYTLNCHDQPVRDLRGSPFVYSQERNTFVAQGCNQIAFLMSNGTRVSACASICDVNEDIAITAGKCKGAYCCETSLPSYLSEYNVTTENLGNSSQVGEPCKSYAVIVEQDTWASLKSWVMLENILFQAVLEWEIVNSTIKLPATATSNCNNTNVTSSQHSHSGRRCYCDEGYGGNPYIDRGCTRLRDRAPVIEGPPRRSLLLGIIFASLGSIILLLGSWWLYKVLRKRIVKKRKEKYFNQNGGLLLQQKFSSGEVNVEKAKHFSLKDLEKATDHFNVNRVLGKGGQGTVYKGMLADGQIIAVKKFSVQGKVEEFINEFVILSQISHRNVVKLLGCCLETEIPLLVYEFIPNGNLFEYLHDQNEDLLMTWDMRLRIAIEVAGALFYLHSAANQPIYHRDIKSTNILLDGKYRAKVADFGASRMISIEETHLTTAVQGTFGYLDPEYFYTSQFTEKSDVYSYGVVLIELLTGQKPISSLRSEEAKSLASHFVLSMEENRLFDIIDERVAKDGDKEHIIAVANLAYRCLALNGTKRPTMRDVASELDGIWRLERKPNERQNLEEIELGAIEDYQPWSAYLASHTVPIPSNRTPTSEVMPFLTK